MKTTRIILFVILFFSEMVSSGYIIRRVAEVIGGGSFVDFSLLGLRQLQIYFSKKKFLAVVDKQVLVGDPLEKFYFTSLNLETVEKVRDALKSLDIPDSFAEKILILGKKDVPGFFNARRSRIVAVTCLFDMLPSFLNPAPLAIFIDNEFLVGSSPVKKRFAFLHEAGHVKSFYLGTSELSNRGLTEVIADTYVLDFFARHTKKDDFKSLLKNIEHSASKPCLNYQELVYHAKKLFDMHQRANELDVPTYAQKIVADRKINGYEQEVRQGCRKLLKSIYDNENNPNLKNLLQKFSL